MNQAELIARIAEVLESLPGLGSAFLGGSHGRGEADAFRDVDVYVVVAEAGDVPDVLGRLARMFEQIMPILFFRRSFRTPGPSTAPPWTGCVSI